MAETLTMDRLEKLLETMDPAAIRAMHGQAPLPAECEALLAAFEAMDEDLDALKLADTPPALPELQESRQEDLAAVPLMASTTPARRSNWKRHLSWALPIAAALVFGVLITTDEIKDEFSPAAMDTQKNAGAPIPEKMISEDLMEEEAALSDSPASFAESEPILESPPPSAIVNTSPPAEKPVKKEKVSLSRDEAKPSNPYRAPESIIPEPQADDILSREGVILRSQADAPPPIEAREFIAGGNSLPPRMILDEETPTADLALYRTWLDDYRTRYGAQQSTDSLFEGSLNLPWPSQQQTSPTAGKKIKTARSPAALSFGEPRFFNTEVMVTWIWTGPDGEVRQGQISLSLNSQGICSQIRPL